MIDADRCGKARRSNVKEHKLPWPHGNLWPQGSWWGSAWKWHNLSTCINVNLNWYSSIGSPLGGLRILGEYGALYDDVAGDSSGS